MILAGITSWAGSQVHLIAILQGLYGASKAGFAILDLFCNAQHYDVVALYQLSL
jgi:hypothetical protein